MSVEIVELECGCFFEAVIYQSGVRYNAVGHSQGEAVDNCISLLRN